MKQMVAPLFVMSLIAAFTPEKAEAAPSCPYWSCEEQLDGWTQQTKHRFVSSDLQGDIHCNGNPPGHGTCHTGWSFDTCYSHGVCHPAVAISEVENLIAEGRHDMLRQLLDQGESGVEFVHGGIALVSTCSDAIIAAYPLPEADLQLLRRGLTIVAARS